MRKNKWFDGSIIISYFGGSNNIFADCIVKQGRKRPLDKPKRMIEGRERERKVEGEI